MIHALSIWLLVAAFFGAGLFNAIGTRATLESFARWGYPSWWHRVTGGLEILSAILIALPPGRDAGLVLGAIIIAVAALTVRVSANIRNLRRLACSSFSSGWRRFRLEVDMRRRASTPGCLGIERGQDHAATIGFYLSGVFAIAIIFIGCRFLLAPSTAAAAYGVPAGGEPHSRAYLSAKGIRDIASGLFIAILIAHGTTHVLGWFMLAATLIPVADAMIVLRQGGSRTVAFGVHGGTAVTMLIISGLLLIV